ncbi:FlxA-like family protein [Desulfovibrio mangrovi]|uniref:FlxA-like family protein n=1 Tax=Desulfovibrio mangrovi TaxID=2976983 RepID=UPI002246C6F7|nr:FlxA-like family protein [Desulfovibrio mangrovi]UZP66446.1 FlxA-like family protein [Desulfovibrio mangrovi]
MQISGSMFKQYSQMGSAMRVDDPEQAARTAAADRVPAREDGVQQGAAGDNVKISEEGRSLAASMKPGGATGAGGSEESGKTSQEQMIERIKKQIQKLQEEIKELQNDMTLSDEEKAKQLQMKQSELMQLQTQLQKAQEELLKSQGLSLGGGTRAQGFGNSLT